MKGFFITIEGPEGAGKTTQISLLKEYLETKGYKVVLTREPGGTPIAESLRQILKYHDGDEVISDKAELLLFAAGRSQHITNVIKPAVEKGQIILCDRFVDSTTAYQGYARGQNLEKLKMINEYSIGDNMPILTLLLDLTTETSYKRTNKRIDNEGDVDRFETAGFAFHEKVRNGFLEIAHNAPKRVKIIDADNNIENIHETIKKEINILIGEKKC